MQLGRELPPVPGCALPLLQHGVQRPGLHWHEGVDFPLPVNHHAQGHRLDAARRQAALHPPPQQRAYLIPHQPVEDAPGLLGVDQLHINFAGMPESLFHGLAGNFVEHHPLGLGGAAVPLGRRLQVPRYGLAFPVGVGGEVDVPGGVAGCLEVFQQGTLVLHHHIGRLEILLHLDADFALGQVAQVALRRGDHVFVAENLADGAGLGRRLHNHQVFAAGSWGRRPGGAARRRLSALGRSAGGGLALLGRSGFLVGGGGFGLASAGGFLCCRV